MEVKAQTFAVFLTHYAALPMSPVLVAYLVSYAEFILPIMLVLGLGTRHRRSAIRRGQTPRMAAKRPR